MMRINIKLTFHHLILHRKRLSQEASDYLFFFNKSQGLKEIIRLNQNGYTILEKKSSSNLRSVNITFFC